MNDLFFIKYRAKIMLVDTMDMPRDVELAHRRLCDFVWATDRPPSCNTQVLRDICRVSDQDWLRVRGGLEAKGWHEKNGFFCHKGTQKTLEEAHEDHRERVNRTKAATAARLTRVKRNDTRHVERNEVQAEAEAEAEAEAITINSTFPSLEEVKNRAAIIGMTPEEAEVFWNHFEASGWVDKNGNPITNWQAKQATWNATARARPLEAAHKQKGEGARPKSVFEIKAIIEAKRTLAAEIRSCNVTETGLSEHWASKEKRTEYLTLMREIKELTNKLSRM